MKKNLSAIVLGTLLMLSTTYSKGQAWEKNTNTLSLGFGASQFFHLDNYYYSSAKNVRNWYSPTTGQLNFQGEFGVHKYVGIGFTTGIGGRAGLLYDYAGEINIPIGMLVNFHFYQLIADKTQKNIHADKLDIYAGLGIGSGVAITYYKNSTRIVPLAFGGLHAGIRYYFTPKVGLNGEVGWGKSIVNVGFVFKL
jgi:hypothetical protein